MNQQTLGMLFSDVSLPEGAENIGIKSICLTANKSLHITVSEGESLFSELSSVLYDALGIVCVFERASEAKTVQDPEPILKTEGKKPDDKKSADIKPVSEIEKAASSHSEENVIWGKPAGKTVASIGTLTPQSGRCLVSGRVFWCDSKKVPGTDETRFSFELTDGTGSIKIMRRFKDDDMPSLKDGIGTGSWVEVSGSVSYSDYDKDLVIRPTGIAKAERIYRHDDAEEKRVELHLHTNMSAMDALCSTTDVIELAAKMGHKAVAITDHGVLQAFPEAMSAEKKVRKNGVDFKVIYGVEAYVIDDLSSARVVEGPVGEFSASGPIVFFDIETTGLNPKDCEIIEIAAVIAENDSAVREYHAFVKPEGKVPEDITKLTGITQEMADGGRPIAEVLPEFLAFCGNMPLCAHNASFDMSFIKKYCNALGIERTFTVIDSLVLAQMALPDQRHHKLNVLAEQFNLSFNHHRAGEDAAVLSRIYYELLRKLNEADKPTALLSDLNRLGAGKETYHFIVLVKNQQGLRDLYELVSVSHLKYFKRHPIIPMSLLNEKRANLLFGSACEAGELFRAVAAKRPDEDVERIASFFDYLEIQPTANNRFMINEGLARDEQELRDFNIRISELAEKLGKPLCATCDVHFIDPEDSIYREIIMTGMKYADAGRQAPLYYHTTDEMLREFSYLGEQRAKQAVIYYPNMIADMCEPVIPVKQGTYPPHIENSAELLEKIAIERAHELYAENGVLHPVIEERMKAELTPIVENGFDVMYVIAQKLVAESNKNGYIVGSRGSVGSSFVAYLAGITEVNSLAPHYRCPKCHHTIFGDSEKYHTGADMPDMDCPKCGSRMEKDGFDIPFFTFLGFKGEKEPDIDLNFSGEYQAQAHKHLLSLFGEDHVFRAGTIGTVKDKTAFGFVKKYLESKGMELPHAEMDRLVAGCTGIKRTTGQHPGGLIILPDGMSIYDFTPVQHPADDPGSDIITTHFDYHSIHDNLLKFDMLGHDDPTMLRHLYDLTGVDPQKVPMDDKQTMKIFTDISPLNIKTDDILEQTGAAAIPEFGTKFVRGILMETKPTTLDGLIRISGLSHGTNVWLNNAQELVQNGTADLSQIISARDDITSYLVSKGLDPQYAFNISEAVRKGKGLKPDWEAKMLENDVPAWYVESCKKIAYLYPKAHATAYVMNGFRIAYYKVHYPLAFYSAYFTIRAGAFDAEIMAAGDDVVRKKYYELKELPKKKALEEDMMSTLEIVHEFYKRGFSFEPVDIMRSELSSFKISGNSLILPFTSLKGVGETAARSIVREREKEPFISAEDIVARCEKTGWSVIDVLERAGALKSLPRTAQMTLFDFM